MFTPTGTTLAHNFLLGPPAFQKLLDMMPLTEELVANDFEIANLGTVVGGVAFHLPPPAVAGEEDVGKKLLDQFRAFQEITRLDVSLGAERDVGPRIAQLKYLAADAAKISASHFTRAAAKVHVGGLVVFGGLSEKEAINKLYPDTVGMLPTMPTVVQPSEIHVDSPSPIPVSGVLDTSEKNWKESAYDTLSSLGFLTPEKTDIYAALQECVFRNAQYSEWAIKQFLEGCKEAEPADVNVALHYLGQLAWLSDLFFTKSLVQEMFDLRQSLIDTKPDIAARLEKILRWLYEMTPTSDRIPEALRREFTAGNVKFVGALPPAETQMPLEQLLSYLHGISPGTFTLASIGFTSDSVDAFLESLHHRASVTARSDDYREAAIWYLIHSAHYLMGETSFAKATELLDNLADEYPLLFRSTLILGTLGNIRDELDRNMVQVANAERQDYRIAINWLDSLTQKLGSPV